MFIASFVLAVLFAGILQQIGAPIIYISLLLMAFVIGLYMFSGLLTKTMRFTAFQTADKQSRPFYNGMATASGMVSGAVFITYAGYIYTNGTDFLALFLGMLLGIGFLTLFFAARIARSSETTLAGVLFPPGTNRFFASVAVLAVIAVSFALLLAQIQLLALFVSAFYDISADWGATLIVSVAVISLVFGGMQALSVTRMLAYPVMLAALFVPLAWLSATYTGFFIPQIAYGDAAVTTTMEIDREMLSANLVSQKDLFNPVKDYRLFGGFNYFAVLVTIAMAFASLPHLLQHFTTVQKGNQGRKTGIWTLVLVALVLTLLPAAAAFAKLDLYTALLGLQLEDMNEEVPWIFDLSGKGDIPLVILCGSLVSDAQEAISACGQSGDYFVSVNDISVNPDYLMLAFALLSDLPQLVNVIVVTGALLAIFTTVDGLLLVSANTLTVDFYHRILKPKSPPGIRLFMNRFFLALFGGILLATANYVSLPSEFWFAAGMALAAASLFPALIARIWIRKLSDAQLGVGMLMAIAGTSFLLWSNLLGNDLVYQSGDEWKMQIPGLVEMLEPLGFGIPGVIIFCLAAAITGGIEHLIRLQRERRKVSATA